MRSTALLPALVGLALVACSGGPDVSDVPSSSEAASSQSQALATPRSRTKLLRVNNRIPNQYIVVLRDSALSAASVDSIAADQARATGGQVGRTYRHALHGYVLRADQAQVQRLLEDPRVKYVEEDGVVQINATQADATWGLDRVDQRLLPLDTTYTYNVTGAGVNAYVIDTGIRITHSEFGGRAAYGFDAVGDGNGANDCHGHGTHVAGTVGGSTWGMAKAVNLFAVRVLDCGGSGTFSGVIAGIDWVTANRILPAVANMSLGGSATQAVDDAVTASINSGVVYAVAAGNSGTDACLFSPARTPAALTAAASDINDNRAFFSNIGTCVDMFAPGVNITSAWIDNDTATNTISGTSMASPHVAGAAALYLSAHPEATPAEVEAGLESHATPEFIQNPGPGTPNLLLYTAFIGGGGGGDPTPPTVTLTSPAEGAELAGTVELQADASDDVGVIRVVFYAGGTFIGYDDTAPYSFSWNTGTAANGAHALKARALDANGNIGDSAAVTVTVNNPGAAQYDPSLGAPKCATVDSVCDTGSLVVGRGMVGPELNAPNTIYSSCYDGDLGSFHSDESLDRIRVFTEDGSPLEAGKQVRVEATVWAYADGSGDSLDLFYTSNGENPSWAYLTTLVPQGGGLQVLSATYTLPVGASFHAIRGNFRYLGAPGLCDDEFAYNDRDDLIFAVGGDVMQPPEASFTVSCTALTCSFTDTSTDPDGHLTDYYWDFGDGTFSFEQHPTHAYAAPGTYQIAHFVLDDQGLFDGAFQTLEVIALPPVASFNVSCVALACSFTDTSTDPDNAIASWSWSFGDGYGASLRNPVHAFLAAGTYTVTLTATDASGLTGSVSKTVTVTVPNIHLTASKVKSGKHVRVTLAWTGAQGPAVDVYRNGVLLEQTENDGAYGDTLTKKGTYNYRVCMPSTGYCSNIATVKH